MQVQVFVKSNNLLFLIFLLLFSTILSAQQFAAKQIAFDQSLTAASLKHCKVFTLETSKLQEYMIKNNYNTDFTLQLPDKLWNIHLESSELTSNDYTLQVYTERGIEISKPTITKAFTGHTDAGGKVRLTIDKDFLYGYIEHQGELWFIEPAFYINENLPFTQYVLYPASAAIPMSGMTCGVTELQKYKGKYEDLQGQERPTEASSFACYDLQLAIASDLSMYTKYSSNVTLVENHNIGVINNVEGDYSTAFTHNLNFVIVTQVVITTTDPWNPTTDAGDLLDSFADWGTNFNTTHDLGELWTNRNFDGSTVGIAYLSALCINGFKYHALQDFTTTNAQALRCMVSHEIGHNLNLEHDAANATSCPPNFIMCPFVSNTTAWSSTSVSDLNSYLPGKINANCLTPCSGGGGGSAPVASFTLSPSSPCAGTSIQFTSTSTNSPTTFAWSFPGGSPSSSSIANPMVTYAAGGNYNVSLTASNANGSNTSNQTVTVALSPVASFNTSATGGLSYSFTNTSTSATTYLWNFGDGLFSNTTNATHTYSTNGTYLVTLQATNACGSTTFSQTITTAPTAGFTSNVTVGCNPMTVTFSPTAGASATYQWNFQGGNPATSTQSNPTVIYANAGNYQVSLIATNSGGSNTNTINNYITVAPSPTAQYVYTNLGGNTISFTNISTNGQTYSWNFGDGTPFSGLTNPTHTYASGGTYTVVLTVNNNCGSTNTSQIITLGSAPTAAFNVSNTNGCAPFTAQFTNTSSANATGYSWSFIGGTPATSSSATPPAVTYSAAGTYTVILTVSNSAGTSSATQTITVNTTPSTSFSTAVNGSVVNFTNTTTNGTSYSWNFGDATAANTQANPSHTYTVGGNYTVVLSATNACGTTTATQTVQIIQAPTAAFNVSNTNGCAPFTAQFTNTSSANATGYSWSFTGGTPATSTSATPPAVTYSSAGTYTVILTVSNGAGTSSATQTISVNTTPSPSFSTVVNGSVVNFTNTTTNGTSYSWNFGDATAASTQANPSHTYAVGGNYTVVLTATNACGTTTASQTVQITQAPTAAFNVSNTNGCAPFTAQFTNTSSANATGYSWSFTGGTPATSTSATPPAVTYSSAGTYTVILTVSNSAGTSSATQTISVNTTPSPSFSTTVNGSVVNFTNTTTNGTSYSWNFGDATAASTQANPSHTYAVGGNYTVVLTATNACGTTTATQTVQITQAPTAAFNVSNTNGCAPFTAQFTNTSSSNATGYSWSFTGGTPATSSLATPPAVIYSAAGTYIVILTVSNGAGTSSATQTISVNTTPSPSFSTAVNGSVVNFTNTTTNGTSYSWNFGDATATNTQANPSHTYAVGGNYNVVLTATNACGTTTATQTVQITQAPTAAFNLSNTNGCAPFTAQFTNTSSANATGYSWSFAGGTPATSTSATPPAVIYSASGTYTVILTVSNSAGTSSATQTISVNTTPSPSFSTAVNGSVVNFTNTTTNGTSYSWNFGDATAASTQANPSHTYAVGGNYTVVLTATNACGTTTASQTVQITQAPTAAFNVSNTNGCAPFTAQFTNTSSSNATGYSWSFTGGTPATSSSATPPAVTYSAAGTYTVILTISNSAGTSSATQTISVNTTPSPSFTTTVNGSVVNFTNTTTNGTSYSWNFGDATATNTQANPSHTYAVGGNYTVVLTTTNACGTTTATQTVQITQAPTAAFNVSNTNGCAPFTAQFTNTSSANATGYSWSFTGGTPATSNSATPPAVTYSAAGTYTVILTVSNGAGTSSATQTISVNTTPSPSFTNAVNGSVVNFTNNSTNAASYLWDFGDGSMLSAEEAATHTYTASGTFTVVLKAFNDCGSSTATSTVTILLPPSANFTVLSTSGCAPFTAQFENTSSVEATSYAWSFAGGNPNSSTEQTPLGVIFDTPGEYEVILTASNAAGSATYTQMIIVNGAPSASFSQAIVLDIVSFSNTSLQAVDYSWDFGDGSSPSTLLNPIHQYGASGNYTVVLTATNDCGSVTYSQNIEIITPPVAAFTPSANTGCIPFTVLFANTSTGIGAEYQWIFDGGTPASFVGANPPAVTYANIGEYTAVLIATNAVGTSTSMETIMTEAIPSATFATSISEDTVQFSYNGLHATTFNWTFGDGGSSDEQHPQHIYAIPDMYNVTLTVSNICGGAVFQDIVDVQFVAIQELGLTESVNVSPNPSDGIFQVKIDGLSTNALVRYELIDVLGRVLLDQTDVPIANHSSIWFDATHLHAAVYICRVSQEEKQGVVRVVKQ